MRSRQHRPKIRILSVPSRGRRPALHPRPALAQEVAEGKSGAAGSWGEGFPPMLVVPACCLGTARYMAVSRPLFIWAFFLSTHHLSQAGSWVFHTSQSSDFPILLNLTFKVKPLFHLLSASSAKEPKPSALIPS